MRKYWLLVIVMAALALPVVALAQDVVTVPADPGLLLQVILGALCGGFASAVFAGLKARFAWVAKLGDWTKRTLIAGIGAGFGALLALIPGGPFEAVWTGLTWGFLASGGAAVIHAGVKGKFTAKPKGGKTPRPPAVAVALLVCLAGVAFSGCAEWYSHLTPTEKKAVDATEECLPALIEAGIPCLATCLKTPGQDCEGVCVATLCGQAGTICGQAYARIHSDQLAAIVGRAVGLALDLYAVLRAGPDPQTSAVTGPAPGVPAGEIGR